MYMKNIPKPNPTYEAVRQMFDYKDGKLYWKIKKKGVSIGTVAGCESRGLGYIRYFVVINGKMCLVSRIIFLWHHGYMPKEVDHININPSDNRIENLRAATRSQNNMNRNSNKVATSQYLGVSFDKGSKSWRAKIGINRISIKLGYFKTEEEAALVYNKAAVKYFGEFANPNIIKPKKQTVL